MQIWLLEFARETFLHVHSFQNVLLKTFSSKKPSYANLLESIPGHEMSSHARTSLFLVPETLLVQFRQRNGQDGGRIQAKRSSLHPPEIWTISCKLRIISRIISLCMSRAPQPFFPSKSRVLLLHLKSLDGWRAKMQTIRT